MARWIRKNWKAVLGAIILAIVYLFGSIKDAFFFLETETGIQFSVYQLALLGIASLGLILLGLNLLSFRKGRTREIDKLKSLRIDSHELGIIGDKREFLRGQTVKFRGKAKGYLNYGFYDVRIFLPKGQMLSSGRNYTWSADPRTMPSYVPNTKGKLHGRIDDEGSEWGWRIPTDYPLGEYTALIGIYYHFPLSLRLLMKLYWQALVQKKMEPLENEIYRNPVREEVEKFTVVESLSS